MSIPSLRARTTIARTVPSTAAATALALIAAAAPTSAAAATYVALGDSYSSGVGTRSYISDGTNCQRSTQAFPSLISAAKGYALNFRACSGAKIPDVTNTQLSALSSSTGFVSISVGGNDAGFASVLTECAQPGWMSDCNGAVDGAQAYIKNTLPTALSSLYASIRAKAPNAVVTVVGYPRVFMGEDCNAFTWFSPQEQTRLNQTADQLNAVLSNQASAKGFTFANPTSAFIGHAVCDDVEWLNGLSNPISESYHPNVAGHASGYTPVVSPRLTGTALRVSPALERKAARQADSLAAQQRSYASADRLIEPQVVQMPDLSTPQARSAAARAGVDLSSRASVDAADRAFSARQAAAHAATG